MTGVQAPPQEDIGQTPTLGGGSQISVSQPLPPPASFLPYSVLQPRQKLYKDPAPDPQAGLNPESLRFQFSQDCVVSAVEIPGRKSPYPSNGSSAQRARSLQPALAALLDPLCRALPVPLGQHQQWAGPNKSRLSRHRRQADPLRCTVGMRWSQGLPGGMRGREIHPGVVA